MAAGSPIGSSRASTIDGSIPTTSGAISISCSFTPNWRATMRACARSSGIASSFWSSGRKPIV